MEDRKQDRMPIKGRGIDDGKKKGRRKKKKKKGGGENRGTNNRGEKMRANQLD
jgi:hypothetical protein